MTLTQEEIAQSAFDSDAFDLVLQDIDGDASSILKKLKNTSRTDVVTELYSKLDPTALCDIRTSLFDTAVGIYDEQLENAGQLGKASLTLVDRRGEHRSEKLSKDIISLICYNMRMKDEFPRDVTSSKSVYVTLADTSDTAQAAKVQIPTKENGEAYSNDQMIELLHTRTNEYETSIRKLWEYIYNLEKIIKIQAEDKDEGKEKSSEKIVAASGADTSKPGSQKTGVIGLSLRKVRNGRTNQAKAMRNLKPLPLHILNL